MQQHTVVDKYYVKTLFLLKHKGPHTPQVKLCKKLHEKLNWMFSGTAQVCQLSVSCVCLPVRVTTVDKNRYTKETVGFPEWTAQFSAWKTTGKDSSEACAFACQNCAAYSAFPSGIASHRKIGQFNWECIAPLRSMLAMCCIRGTLYATCKVSDVGNASICQTPLRFSHHNFTLILIIQLTKHMDIPVNSPMFYI
jgi:hypothetical protein